MEAVAKPTGQAKDNDQKAPKGSGPKAISKLALAHGHEDNQEKIEQAARKDPGVEFGFGKVEWLGFEEGNESVKGIGKTMKKVGAIFILVMKGLYRLDRKSCLLVHFSIGSKVFEDLMDFAIGAQEFWVNELPTLRAGKRGGIGRIG